MQKVGKILKAVPAAATNNTLLLVMYWMLYDHIKIPPNVARELISHGSRPESVIRNRRFYVKGTVRTR